MMNRKVWPLLLIVLFAGIFWAFTGRNTDEDLYVKQQKLLTLIGAYLEQKHYSPKAIDDVFSKQVFDKYISSIDPDKNLFLQSDITALSKYATTIDDEIKGTTKMAFYPAVGAIYTKRVNEAIDIYKDILSRPFNFSADEKVELDGDKLNYSATEADRKEMWRKRLKYMTLDKFVELQQQRDTNAGKDTSLNKTDAQLEQEARKRVLTALDRNYNRIKVVFTPDQQFSSFVNTITDLMDPHTEYFPPVEKRGFDEEMSGHFFGIGAQLKDDNGSIKIASLIPGSPAWKSGQIQINDEVIKVGQGSDTPVDIAGYAVTDVVKLIRGSKDTEVKITFKKADGSLQVVSLIRDEIVQDDETYVRSSIVQSGDKKVGYIYLPIFYADFDKAEGRRCSQDVANELVKLKKENVDGIIVDLRNNGGGALREVVDMVGLFIKSGPVVQVKDRDGKPITLSDDDATVLYEGPLAVMVNELSASASEIFAAAIQDYHRGIIVGSTSTYGKGTVQKPLPLGRPIDIYSGQTEYGALKLTFEKFYRVNGGSTQLKGVTSDIVLPDVYEYLKFREKDNPSSLNWDQIPQANYQTDASSSWNEIEKKAMERISNDSVFNKIKSNTDWLSKNFDKEYHLNINTYKKEQLVMRNTIRLDDSLTRLKQPMNMEFLSTDKDKFYNNPDKAKGERYQQWLKNAKSDIYINETVNIVKDIFELEKNSMAKQ